MQIIYHGDWKNRLKKYLKITILQNTYFSAFVDKNIKIGNISTDFMKII